MDNASPRSGYAVYNPAAKRRRKRNLLEKLYPPLPDAKFDIIYADPPWHYGGKMQFDKTSIKDENPEFKKNVFISAADFKYPTLPTDELMRLQVDQIASDDCLLFLWATNPHLDQAIELGKAWGFDYKTVAFVWNKMVHNPGKYTMSYCELCLVLKRGRIPSPRGARNVKQLVSVPRGKHSEKPDQVRRNIELMFPTQSKIELFARHKSPGWDVWGLETFPEYESKITAGEDDHRSDALTLLDL